MLNLFLWNMKTVFLAIAGPPLCIRYMIMSMIGQPGSKLSE